MRGVFETVRTLVYAILIALVVRTFFFEPFNIPSGSMKPTLLVGDYLFVSKYSYGYSRHSFPLSLGGFDGRIFGAEPERGDVAVFKLPRDNSTDYIKRIIGLPGDRLQMRNGTLIINGTPVQEQRDGTFSDEDMANQNIPLVRETLPNGVTFDTLDMLPNGSLDSTREFVVPEGHVFAMGDNRDNSLDSRTTNVGMIPMENLIGRAEILFFSTNGSASLWEIWRWPTAIRWSRLFNPIY